jgi:hypothetical protein
MAKLSDKTGFASSEFWANILGGGGAIASDDPVVQIILGVLALGYNLFRVYRLKQAQHSVEIANLRAAIKQPEGLAAPGDHHIEQEEAPQ